MAEVVSRAGARGGRTGEVWSLNSSYRHQTTIAGTDREGVTPEELIAGAWAACYGTTFASLAKARRVEVGTPLIEAAVTLSSSAGTYTITEADLRVVVDVPVPPDKLDELIEEAHGRCPVSKVLSSGAEEVTVRRGA
jgi:organic hydroperoxide reductase OsmC/OhrA